MKVIVGSLRVLPGLRRMSDPMGYPITLGDDLLQFARDGLVLG